MHYEINVSLNGHHFFATHERSLRDSDEAKKVFDAIKTRFPKSEGFEVAVTRVQRSSTNVTQDFLANRWGG